MNLQPQSAGAARTWHIFSVYHAIPESSFVANSSAVERVQVQIMFVKPLLHRCLSIFDIMWRNAIFAIFRTAASDLQARNACKTDLIKKIRCLVNNGPTLQVPPGSSISAR